ncbi:hypothetical protein [Chamaesiphon sp. OTE_8_metabat_110]|uniref:hypothetical protein n=1 Tax=Chamaesiphon sp. OTE_8_metabat_110 TaxID=2964696 RepID=UPI00286B37FE|nr:hypothetical protein [Chamaesiphon sp. OTE_8_metabat_110]
MISYRSIIPSIILKNNLIAQFLLGKLDPHVRGVTTPQKQPTTSQPAKLCSGNISDLAVRFRSNNVGELACQCANMAHDRQQPMFRTYNAKTSINL